MAEKTDMQRGRRRVWVWPLLATWLVICLAVLLWLVGDYSSLMAWIGAWQFRHFGRFFPTTTITLTVLVLVLPFAGLIDLLTRRQHRKAAQDDGIAIDPPIARVIASARRGHRFFGMLSLLLLVAVVVALVVAADMPTAEGEVHRVALDGSSAPVEGHARYTKAGHLGRIARLDEHVAFAIRTIWVAPLYAGPPAGILGEERAKFLTEMVPAGPDQFRPIGTGVLVRRGLPPELEQLYRELGIPIAYNNYLLMTDSDRPRWRLRALATQGGMISILALVVALLLLRQERRLKARSKRY